MSDQADLVEAIGRIVATHHHATGTGMNMSTLGNRLAASFPSYKQILGNLNLRKFLRANVNSQVFHLTGQGPTLFVWPTEQDDFFRNLNDDETSLKNGQKTSLMSTGKGHLESPSDNGLNDILMAIADVPSAISYAWSASNTVVVETSSSNYPVFPFATSERDHSYRLLASRTLAEDLVNHLSSSGANVRPEYKEQLSKYSSRLPIDTEVGNILLADAAARTIRSMFEAESGILPTSFAAYLKTFLEQHIGLRAFYPDVEAFYRDVQNGRLQEALPLDAVEGVVGAVRDHTPQIFDPMVQRALGDSRPPATASPKELTPPTGGDPLPPPDPLGSLNSRNANDYQVAGVVNKLWSVFLKGRDIGASFSAWRSTYSALEPHVRVIVNWLSCFRE